MNITQRFEEILKKSFQNGFCKVIAAGFGGKVNLLIVDAQFRGMDEFAKIKGVLNALSNAISKGKITEKDINQIASIKVYSHTELL